MIISLPVSTESVIAKMKRAFNRNLNYDSTPPMDASALAGPRFPRQASWRIWYSPLTLMSLMKT